MENVVYVVCEYSDYGLIDMSEAQVFDSIDEAEAAAITTTETRGYRLDIITLPANFKYYKR